jgi:N-acetylglucosamine-6-phosphate deacetylase
MNIPGFVDLQVNGHNGIDFSSPDLTREQFISASKALINQGTVVFLPTVITSSVSTFERNLKLIAGAIRHKDLEKHIPGIHLEGPFISGKEGAVGAHNPEWVQKPNIPLLDKFIRWSDGTIKLMTIAAEPEGADELCRYASNKGITVSLGHHLADYEDLKRLAASGARSLTHLGNGIPRMIDRHHNPLWAGLANTDLTAFLITDGHHLPPEVIKTMILAKGTQRIIVTSDASPIAGLPPGRYDTLGNEVLLEESGRLYNPKTGYLVGSSSTMIECMNYLSSLNLLGKEELLDTGFYNPLQLIGVDPEWVISSFSCRLAINDNDLFTWNPGSDTG